MLLHLINNKCPHCHTGNVFRTSNLLTYRKDPMNKECPECHYKFEKEPGFYWGAMYASYALGVAEAFVTYILCQLVGLPQFAWTNLIVVVLVLLLLSPFNFRMARLIWLYIFSALDAV